MNILDLVQGSEEWKKARRKHITATDSSIILGLNPFQTIEKLIDKKLLGIEEPQNDAMKRGSEMEPLALNEWILDSGIVYSPLVATSKEHPFLMASFDGVSQDHKSIVEIKCGRKAFQQLEQGIIPEYYLVQMQHQMIVADVTECMYICFDGSVIINQLVSYDSTMAKDIIEKGKEFYDMIFSLGGGNDAQE